MQAVLGPLFDLVEIAIVYAERIVGFLVGPIVIHRTTSLLSAAGNVLRTRSTILWPRVSHPTDCTCSLLIIPLTGPFEGLDFMKLSGKTSFIGWG
jgi:hypothetical protein